jgi:hypothetical protein
MRYYEFVRALFYAAIVVATIESATGTKSAIVGLIGVQGAPVSKDLVTCLQDGTCGVSSVCHYSFVYDEPCVSGDGKNCSKDGSGKTESSVEGNIMLMKNGLDRTVEYTWNVVGYAFGSKIDDASARRYDLPAGSYAYFDTGVPIYHTVRLMSGGETIDTATSSKTECTVNQACQYLLRACQSSLVFVNTASMEPKIACMERSKACGYFVHLPDLSSEGGNANGGGNGDDDDDGSNDDDNDNGDGEDEDGLDKGRASITPFRKGANDCMVDCIWRWYPSRYLPSKSVLATLLDSLDAIRRAHEGMTLSPSSCTDLVYTDDKYDPFHTTRDDEIKQMLDRDGIESQSSGIGVGAKIILIEIGVIAGLVLIACALIWYFGGWKKVNERCMGCMERKDEDEDERGTGSDKYEKL